MAISISNFVDITTTFPTAKVAGRSFGGLVFTTKAASATGETDPKWAEYAEKFNAGDVYQFDYDEVCVLFGGYDEINKVWLSDEAQFANGYYSYLSPTGRFASKLAFAKIMEGETAVEAFNRVRGKTNLFGSFTFLSQNSSSESSSEDDGFDSLRAVAAENAKLDTRFLFVVNDQWNYKGTGSSVPIEAAKVVAVAEKKETDMPALIEIPGVVLVAGATNVSSYMPMAILASTDYTNGTVVNFMFKQFLTEEPTVHDDATYTLFNKDNISFYGTSQTNGQVLNFYQRGYNTDGQETSVYCNEMWFKSFCETNLMSVFMNNERLSADAYGVDTVRTTVLNSCSDAVVNGMFMVKEVDAQDARDISILISRLDGTNEDVQNVLAGISTVGYSVYAWMVRENTDDNGKLSNNGEYVIRYIVFYGTADSVRHIKGEDILIK